MRAIATTDTGADGWPDSLKDRFTAAGAQQLKLLDRKDLPFTSVKGEPRLLATQQPSMQHWPVIVETNRGSWVVTMTQHEDGWRAEAISAWDR